MFAIIQKNIIFYELSIALTAFLVILESSEVVLWASIRPPNLEKEALWIQRRGRDTEGSL